MVVIVNGKQEDNLIDNNKIKARVDYLISLGLSAKDAISVTAEELGVNKNYVKKLVF